MAGGFFGKLFDFDGDGKLSSMERAMDFFAFNEMAKEDEVESVGLDIDEFSYMDEDERRETLEDAGLDPDNYDF